VPLVHRIPARPAPSRPAWLRRERPAGPRVTAGSRLVSGGNRTTLRVNPQSRPKAAILGDLCFDGLHEDPAGRVSGATPDAALGESGTRLFNSVAGGSLSNASLDLANRPDR
jgi:hypothetical protein